jgi:hypothetical protein
MGADFSLASPKGPTISAQIVTVDYGSIITADGLGFSQLFGPGVGYTIGCCSIGGAAGHGGNYYCKLIINDISHLLGYGNWYNNPVGYGSPYGYFTAPETLASAGGGVYDQNGANGGGRSHMFYYHYLAYKLRFTGIF